MIYQQNTSILFVLCAISMVLLLLSRGRFLLLCAVAAYGVNGLLYFLAHRLVLLPVLLPAWGFDISMFNTADERSVAIVTDVIERSGSSFK